MSRYYAMQDYWAEVAPPIDVVLAGFVKFKPRERRRGSSGEGGGGYGSLGDLLKMFPGGAI